MRLAFQRETDELVGSLVVDCFGEEDEAEEGCDCGETGLEPEDVTPGTVGDDYAADDGACEEM